MKKVLIFAPTAPTSGITQYVLNIINHLKNDIEFDIVSYKNHRLRDWAEENNTKYFEFDISPYKQRKEYNNFLKELFSRNYDVVYYNTSTISGLKIFSSAKKYSNSKLVMHSHACSLENSSNVIRVVFTYVHKILRGFANRYFDVKCGCSKLASEWMFGKKGAQDAFIINNAIDVNKFKFSETDREKLREDLGIKTKYVIGHIGRFTLPKNHSYILDVFSEVLKISSDCTLVLIGDGELEGFIKAKIKELKLEEKVILVGFKEDVYRYYSLFDLLLMPSLFESFAMTLVEAQANGLVSLASDTIPQMANVAGLVEFMSLNESATTWAEKVMVKVTEPRQDVTQMICEKGFDLTSQTQKIKELVF